LSGIQCLSGENPDGSPFCANFYHKCEMTSIDVNVQGTPLMGLPVRAYLATSDDVRRSCDGAIVYYAPPKDARALEDLTAQLVI
jgi:hypothetical protein